MLVSFPLGGCVDDVANSQTNYLESHNSWMACVRLSEKLFLMCTSV